MNQPNKSSLSAQRFVEEVIKEAGLQNADVSTLEALSLEIVIALQERINSTIIDSFSEKELFMLRNMLQDHPETDELDAMAMVARTIPRLDELLQKSILDLYDELTANIKPLEK